VLLVEVTPLILLFKGSPEDTIAVAKANDGFSALFSFDVGLNVS
jgi:hypothetical protein